MRRIVIVLLLIALASAPSALAGPSTWFEDVPPCHWAAEAVAEVAELGIFIGFPSDGAYDGVNALRQVFEGLRCGDPSWSLRFLYGAPAVFGLAPEADLTGFVLEPTLLELDDELATVSFALTAVLAEAGVERTESITGTVTLRSDGHGVSPTTNSPNSTSRCSPDARNAPRHDDVSSGRARRVTPMKRGPAGV